MTILFYTFLCLFFVLHSLLADTKVKEKIYVFLPKKYYRLSYNFLSLFLSAFVVYIYINIPHKILFHIQNIEIFGWFLMVSGGIISYFAFKTYNTFEFLGLIPERNSANLAVTGMNKYIRHPLYFATIIMLLGGFFVATNYEYMCFMLLCFLYLFIGIKLEEKKLVATFGESYLAYKAKVPMLFPFGIFKWNK